VPVIPVLGRLKQENHEFEASVGCIVSSSPAWASTDPVAKKKKRKKENQTNKTKSVISELWAALWNV
jgi:hypothetical protein